MNLPIVPFPHAHPFPKVKSDRCINHAYLLTSVFDDPVCWYLLMGRQEFWDRTALSRKPTPFYRLYFGLVIGFLNLWSRDIVNVHKKSGKILVCVKKPEVENKIGFFEDALLESLPGNDEIAYADLLTVFFSPYRNVSHFSAQYRLLVTEASVAKNYDSLFDTLAVLSWLLTIYKMEEEADHLEEPISLQMSSLLVTIELMRETETFILKQKWRWWG